jgi:hypothetical protein
MPLWDPEPDFEWSQIIWHIALLNRFMAKANYPGDMPALPWTQAGTKNRIRASVYPLEGVSREWRKPGKERLAASGKEEV